MTKTISNTPSIQLFQFVALYPVQLKPTLERLSLVRMFLTRRTVMLKTYNSSVERMVNDGHQVRDPYP